MYIFFFYNYSFKFPSALDFFILQNCNKRNNDKKIKGNLISFSNIYNIVRNEKIKIHFHDKSFNQWITHDIVVWHGDKHP